MIDILESYRADIDYVYRWYLFEFVLVAFNTCLSSFTNRYSIPDVMPDFVQTMEFSTLERHRSASYLTVQ